jgi:methyl-accepting chemotaxis protein
LGKYQTSLENQVLQFAKSTNGVMSAYVYLEPTLTGGVYGAWFADDGSGKLLKQPLGTMEDFNPDSEDSAWYYDPIKAGKGVWGDASLDPDLNIETVA